MICDKCHSTLNEEALFCNKCGNQLHKDGFSSQSITENPTAVQEDTQNDNLKAIQDFLNAEITSETVKISSLLTGDNIPDENEFLNDDISLEDTKEIEIPADAFESVLNDSTSASVNNTQNPEILLNSMPVNETATPNECDDIKPTSVRGENFGEVEINPPSLEVSVTATHTQTVTAPDSPFKIAVSMDDSNSSNPNIPSVPHFPNPNIIKSAPTLDENFDYYKEKEETLSDVLTLDLVLIFLFALIPVIGWIYIAFLAFIQQQSAFKKKIARAILLTYLFILLMSAMFLLGLALGLM